jgi:uncharacterized membrane protein
VSTSSSDTRRNIAAVVTIVVGLVLGFLFKKVGIGLLIGLAIGLFTSGLLTGKRK